MKRKYAAFGIAALFVFVMLGSAWPQSDEQLKKLETDRAAAAVKGDVATLEKQTAEDYTFINLYGRMSDKSQMVNAFKTGQTKLTSNEVSDMKVRKARQTDPGTDPTATSSKTKNSRARGNLPSTNS